jgi:hypothetical protein
VEERPGMISLNGGHNPFCTLNVRGRSVCWDFVKDRNTGKNRFEFFSNVLGVARKVDEARGQFGSARPQAERSDSYYTINGKRERGPDGITRPKKRLVRYHSVSLIFLISSRIVFTFFAVQRPAYPGC